MEKFKIKLLEVKPWKTDSKVCSIKFRNLETDRIERGNALYTDDFIDKIGKEFEVIKLKTGWIKLANKPEDNPNPEEIKSKIHYVREFDPKDIEEDWLEFELFWSGFVIEDGFITELSYSGYQDIKWAGKKRTIYFVLQIDKIINLDATFRSGFYETTAEISLPPKYLAESLSYAGNTNRSIWWFATIENKTCEIRIDGIMGYSEKALEDAFANSEAKIIHWWELEKKEKENPNPEEYFGIVDLMEEEGWEEGILLEELKKKLPKEKYKAFAEYFEEETGYDLKEYMENVPMLFTEEGLIEDYRNILIESGEVSRDIAEGYSAFDEVIKSMIADDEMSGYLGKIKIDGKEFWMRLY